MEIRSPFFSSLAEKALEDQALQETLFRLGERFKNARDSAFSLLRDSEELRDRARRIREESIKNLPNLLERLEIQVKRAGGVVHWAPTAREAREIILDLVRTKEARKVVKGKSMISEEIALNDALRKQGVEVFETDLGEYIIQLAQEPPSHIIVPAVHKSKEEISKLFAQKLDVQQIRDPEALTAVAREEIRPQFLEADIGITGVNMAVAQTGSILLVENEGNIRFCLTAPRTHIAVMGIERIVSSLEDLAILLMLLARSATGQNLSTYTSLVTGPRTRHEPDGPEQFHLVLVDNGRSKILLDPELRETLYCIRCGCCLNVCPVYLKTGGHSYGWVYPGPIGAVLTSQLLSPRLTRRLPYASTLCGACAEVCPVKIDLPGLLLALRRRLVEDPNWDSGISIAQKWSMALFSFIAVHPGLFRAVSHMMSLFQSILASGDRWRRVPPPLTRWAASRTLPRVTRPFS